MSFDDYHSDYPDDGYSDAGEDNDGSNVVYDVKLFPMTAGNVACFLTAGNAEFCVKSNRTGTSQQYRVQLAPSGKTLFVSGRRNSQSRWAWFGMVFDGRRFVCSQKSKIPQTDPLVRGFAWVIKTFLHRNGSDRATVYHCGTCGHCGQALNTRNNREIRSGLHELCAEKIFA